VSWLFMGYKIHACLSGSMDIKHNYSATAGGVL